MQNFTQIGETELLTEDGEAYKSTLQSFIRLYSFLSQIIDWQDAELEKLYAYGRLLLTKLPYRTGGGRLQLDDEVEIAAYRNEMTFEGSASLAIGEGTPVYGPTEVGTGGAPEEKQSLLSIILEKINDRMGPDGDWDENDFNPFYQVSHDMAQNESMANQGKVNSKDQFWSVFEQELMKAVIQRSGRNEKLIQLFMSDPEARKWISEAVYEDFLKRIQG